MTIGTVKRLFSDKGFGFLEVAGDRDVFFHASQVTDGRFEQIVEGVQVEFTVREGDRGKEAADVRII